MKVSSVTNQTNFVHKNASPNSLCKERYDINRKKYFSLVIDYLRLYVLDGIEGRINPPFNYFAGEYRSGASIKTLSIEFTGPVNAGSMWACPSAQAVVMGFQEDYDIIKYFPAYISEAPVGLGYSKMAITNAHISSFIRNLGYKAIDCSINDVALSIPMAMQAGIGDLGRHGLLISPRFGARLRLSKVITDLPLVADSPVDFGVTEFCALCKKCADQCPSRSISFGERTDAPVNLSNAGGARKWYINAETCRAYWSRIKSGCNNCVACCPYTKPDTWPHRATFWFTDHLRCADPFYVRMNDLFGYGKPEKPDSFWKEWHPGIR